MKKIYSLIVAVFLFSSFSQAYHSRNSSDFLHWTEVGTLGFVEMHTNDKLLFDVVAESWASTRIDHYKGAKLYNEDVISGIEFVYTVPNAVGRMQLQLVDNDENIIWYDAATSAKTNQSVTLSNLNITGDVSFRWVKKSSGIYTSWDASVDNVVIEKGTFSEWRDITNFSEMSITNTSNLYFDIARQHVPSSGHIGEYAGVKLAGGQKITAVSFVYTMPAAAGRMNLELADGYGNVVWYDDGTVAKTSQSVSLTNQDIQGGLQFRWTVMASATLYPGWDVTVEDVEITEEHLAPTFDFTQYDLWRPFDNHADMSVTRGSTIYFDEHHVTTSTGQIGNYVAASFYTENLITSIDFVYTMPATNSRLQLELVDSDDNIIWNDTALTAKTNQQVSLSNLEIQGTIEFRWVDSRTDTSGTKLYDTWDVTIADVEIGTKINPLAKMMLDGVESWIPVYLSDQKLPGYDSTNDPHDIKAGQFHNSDNTRMQECTAALAYVYQNPNSCYFKDPNVLESVILSLDYYTRSQGINGGFNEYHGWCGVALPNGGNSTRTNGKSSVMGFTLWPFAKSIELLYYESEFSDALDEYMDNDGNGTLDVVRSDAYKYLINDSMNTGSMTGALSWLMDGTGRGHAPNQDVSNIDGAWELDEAYYLLSGSYFKTQTEFDDLCDEILTGSPVSAQSKNYLGKWFSSKKMLLEIGHMADTYPTKSCGYDANYGWVTTWAMMNYAMHDSTSADFLSAMLDGYQYFFVKDRDNYAKGGYHEWRTARRGDGGFNWTVAGLAQDAHNCMKVVYSAALDKFLYNPELFYDYASPHHLQLESFHPCHLLMNWCMPKVAEEGSYGDIYVLPNNDTATYTYTDYNGTSDPQANISISKTGASAETVTWTVYNWDGGTSSYTYVAGN